MFKQTLKLYLISSRTIIPHFLKCEALPRCTSTRHKWDLVTAVCVERHPVITKPKTELEQNVQELLDDIELENSMKCDFELRLEEDAKTKELLKKGLTEHLDPDKVSTVTAQDIEDAGTLELAKFQFASRVTEADRQNIKTSLERRLDKCLLLLVQQKVGRDVFWLPPQDFMQEGETLRQAAERILRNSCGDNLSVKIYGNAPVGFYKYVYPKIIRENGSHGAKIFYYLAKHVKGNVQNNKVKFQWLDRQEIAAALPKPIYRSVSMFLLPE